MKYNLKDDLKHLYRHLKNPVNITGLLFAAVFTAMALNIVLYLMNHSYEDINNSSNNRAVMLAKENIRGDIVSNDGTVLATTRIVDGEEVRYYPYANLFAHVVGYSTYGTTGVEQIANMRLVTSNDTLLNKIENDLYGSKDKGDTVVTTLDVNLQEVASKALGVYKGAIIVTNVKTGEILVMVSKSDYDPNTIADDWDDVINDTKSSCLVNRATQGMYPPGSTFKIFDLIEYIKEHPSDYDKYTYTCGGSLKYDNGKKISCYHGMSHGSLSLEKAFAKSCNCAFANLALSFDRGMYASTLNTMMFNEKLPLELEYKKSFVEIEDGCSDSTLVQSSIGQGTVLMSPMHLNMVTQGIANDGMVMTPMIIKRVESSGGDSVKIYNPSEYRRILSKEEADIVTEYMRSVVTTGTGDVLKGSTYEACGKTGSAEYGTVKGDSHALFTGFAPMNDPEIAVTVVIEGAGSGGDYAVPIAKRIFDAYFGESYN